MPRIPRRSTFARALAGLSFLYAGSIYLRDYIVEPPQSHEDALLANHDSAVEPVFSIPSTPVEHVNTPSLPPECDYCGPTDALCKQYGDHNLARSRAYEGTNSRLRRVIAKAKRGEPVIISVLGGSVTKGHGVKNVDNWTTRFFQFWNQTFPHPDNKLVNGAIPAVTSEYYMSCALEHMDADSDLILVEMAINDSFKQYFIEAFEWLLRRLLALPNHPAILNAQVFALSFDKIASGGDVHLGLAGYYDIPTVSLKNVLSSHILRDSALERDYFVLYPDHVDLRHLNHRGHHMLADLLAAYVRRQTCEEARNKLYERFDPPDSESHLLPSISTIEDIPRLPLYSKYNQNETVPDINPTCMSMTSTKNPLKAFSSDGWVEWSWGDKPYLIGKKPGDKITFEVKVDALGTVSLAYLRSKTLGLGKLKCWLNDRTNKPKFISGYWNLDKLNLVRIDQIVVGAPPGNHLVHCEITKETDDPNGGHEFRIVALTR
ncbi:hypothetical protein FRC03_001017 [Tulasnella sp. 419]|nr:hypothetical protein FRC03_001017 [Tulasnella sp. 419]